MEWMIYLGSFQGFNKYFRFVSRKYALLNDRAKYKLWVEVDYSSLHVINNGTFWWKPASIGFINTFTSCLSSAEIQIAYHEIYDCPISKPPHGISDIPTSTSSQQHGVNTNVNVNFKESTIFKPPHWVNHIKSTIFKSPNGVNEMEIMIFKSPHGINHM